MSYKLYLSHNRRNAREGKSSIYLCHCREITNFEGEWQGKVQNSSPPYANQTCRMDRQPGMRSARRS